MEKLMNIRPTTTNEKLLWERLANKTLSMALDDTLKELKDVKVELKEIKDSIKNSSYTPERYVHLMMIQKNHKQEKRELTIAIREAKEVEDRLVIELGRLNLKLKNKKV